jgi:hypothetical protein
MNYTTLVDDIVTRLAPLVADGIEVERLPETELEYTEAFEAPGLPLLISAASLATKTPA